MRFDFVKTGRVAAVLAATALGATVAATSAKAELVGQLQCNIGPGAPAKSSPPSGRYRAPTARPACRFSSTTVSSVRIGLDVGTLTSGTLTYDVLAIGTPGLGVLQGSYLGAGGGVTLGTGIGVNTLVGGNGQSITLAADRHHGLDRHQHQRRLHLAGIVLRRHGKPAHAPPRYRRPLLIIEHGDRE